jgi:hypothetical protein
LSRFPGVEKRPRRIRERCAVGFPTPALPGSGSRGSPAGALSALTHTPSLIRLYDYGSELSKIRDPRAAGCLLRVSGDELFRLIAPPPTCYSTRSTMDDSLSTPNSLVRFRKTNFDGTKLPIVVSHHQTTTNGMNLPLHNFCSPLQKGELCVTNPERPSVRRDSSLQQLSLRMTREAARFLSHPEHSEGSRASSALRSIADIWVTQSSKKGEGLGVRLRLVAGSIEHALLC